tara:strand:- start:533 stop:1159 length:627 start_codon:yes stop_codon:yes gene_type:complete
MKYNKLIFILIQGENKMTSTTPSQYAHTEEAKYIISLNEKLLTENIALRSTISEKDTEMNTVETELGQRETQVTYMRGLLKNFVEMNDLRKDLNRETILMLTDQLTLAARVETQCKKHSFYDSYFLLTTMLFYILCLGGLSLYVLPLLFICNYGLLTWRTNAFSILNEYTEKMRARKKTREASQKKKSEDLKHIVKGCDFLNEYIDQI